MTYTSNQQFEFQINFSKAYKAADGGHYVEDTASCPEVALTGERIISTIVQSMVDSLKEHIFESPSEDSNQ